MRNCCYTGHLLFPQAPNAAVRYRETATSKTRSSPRPPMADRSGSSTRSPGGHHGTHRRKGPETAHRRTNGSAPPRHRTTRLDFYVPRGSHVRTSSLLPARARHPPAAAAPQTSNLDTAYLVKPVVTQRPRPSVCWVAVSLRTRQRSPFNRFLMMPTRHHPLRIPQLHLPHRVTAPRSPVRPPTRG